MDWLKGEFVVGSIVGLASAIVIRAVYDAAAACAGKWKWGLTLVAAIVVAAVTVLVAAGVGDVESGAPISFGVAWVLSLVLGLSVLDATMRTWTARRKTVPFSLGHLMFLELFGIVAPGGILFLLRDLVPARMHPLLGFLMLQAFLVSWFSALAVGHFAWLVFAHRFCTEEDVQRALAKERILQSLSKRLLSCLSARPPHHAVGANRVHEQ